MASTYICFDIGGTTIKYSLATADGNLLERKEMPTEAHQKGGPGIVSKLKSVTAQYHQNHQLDGIAISTAGMVDPVAGCIFYALPESIPNYTGTQLKKIMEDEFSLACTVENDVNCAALGEMWLGAGAGKSSAFCLTVGTSIGGCAIIDHKIWHGISNSAGEIAYMRIPGGRLHDLASTTHLVRETAQAEGIEPTELDGRQVFAWAKEGRASACLAVNNLAEHLADGIANICTVLNPEVIILGGGIMAQEAYLRPLLTAALQQRLVPAVWEKTELAFAKMQNNAGMLGALHHFLRGQDK